MTHLGVEKEEGGGQKEISEYVTDEFYAEAAEEKRNPGLKAVREEDHDDGGTPGPGLSTRANKKKRKLNPNKQTMLEDEGSGYEEDTDDMVWTGTRRSNRQARYEERSSLEDISPPLHELPGNKEVMDDFEIWCVHHYQSKSTANTAVSSIFRRADGKSLLEFAVLMKPGVKAEQFTNFNSSSDFAMPPSHKDWINGVFRKEQDADAALQ